MAELGVTGFAELGGKVLGPMIRRITPDVPTVTASDMAGVEAIAKAIA
jgi:[acyl-carrier-protein] S-malonyltransferase